MPELKWWQTSRPKKQKPLGWARGGGSYHFYTSGTHYPACRHKKYLRKDEWTPLFVLTLEPKPQCPKCLEGKRKLEQDGELE